MHDALRGPGQLVGVGVPAGDRVEQPRPLRHRVVEHAAEELAEDQRVHDRRAILGLDRRRDVGLAAVQAVVSPDRSAS